ncbi:uncharacterized protein V6R79_025913 [Siganus canaliculatus]
MTSSGLFGLCLLTLVWHGLALDPVPAECRPGRCSAPVHSVDCRWLAPRFFCDATSFRCEHSDSSCGFSGTGFESLEGCEANCSKKVLCYRPMEPGTSPGRSPVEMPKFFYNISSETCEPFTFRGNGSNGNIFHSQEECEALCAGVKGPGPECRPGRCSAPVHTFDCRWLAPRFFCNATSFRCEHSDSSCGFNGTGFESLDGCEANCRQKGPASECQKGRCSAPVHTVDCRWLAPRFFCNATSFRCEHSDSSCGFNGTGFESLEGCEANCSKKVLCYRPMEPGTSLSRNPVEMPKFFYNISSETCERFTFRGNGSNGNIFKSQEECEALCAGVKGPGPECRPGRCSSPVHTFDCRWLAPRFFCNTTSFRCEHSDSSCGFNGTGFESLEGCDANCSKKEDQKPSGSPAGPHPVQDPVSTEGQKPGGSPADTSETDASAPNVGMIVGISLPLVLVLVLLLLVAFRCSLKRLLCTCLEPVHWYQQVQDRDGGPDNSWPPSGLMLDS